MVERLKVEWFILFDFSHFDKLNAQLLASYLIFSFYLLSLIALIVSETMLVES